MIGNFCKCLLTTEELTINHLTISIWYLTISYLTSILNCSYFGKWCFEVILKIPRFQNILQISYLTTTLKITRELSTVLLSNIYCYVICTDAILHIAAFLKIIYLTLCLNLIDLFSNECLLYVIFFHRILL